MDQPIPKLGVRSTRQRTAVITVLREMENFASAKTIHQELLKRDLKVGLTTVYRTLQSLSEAKAVDVLHMPVEQWANEIATKYGFRLTGHDAEVFGLCNQCLASN